MSEEIKEQAEEERADPGERVEKDFRYCVAEAIFGSNKSAWAMPATMVLSELQNKMHRARELESAVVSAKKSVGDMSIENDRLRADLIHARRNAGDAKGSVQANEALAKMAAVYGDDLTWGNVVKRTTDAVRQLQTQAPLMQAAEMELKRMRERISTLEHGAPVDPSQEGHSGDIDKRLMSLEHDLRFFRLLSRVASRLLGMDSLSKRG